MKQTNFDIDCYIDILNIFTERKIFIEISKLVNIEISQKKFQDKIKEQLQVRLYVATTQLEAASKIFSKVFKTKMPVYENITVDKVASSYLEFEKKAISLFESTKGALNRRYKVYKLHKLLYKKFLAFNKFSSFSNPREEFINIIQCIFELYCKNFTGILKEYSEMKSKENDIKSHLLDTLSEAITSECEANDNNIPISKINILEYSKECNCFIKQNIFIQHGKLISYDINYYDKEDFKCYNLSQDFYT